MHRYSTDYGLFHFCIADTEHDWREGTEQYKFIENCLASADRQKQPWLIFAGHRVLGYTSDKWYSQGGAFEEPMGRESLQKLWQKYKVDIAFYGHVHNYERTCPIYEVQIFYLENLSFNFQFLLQFKSEFHVNNPLCCVEPMCIFRKISLLREVQWNNPCCCWRSRKPLIRLQPTATRLESLQRS